MITKTNDETYITINKADNMTTAAIVKKLIDDLKTPADLITIEHQEILIHIPDGAHFGYSLNALREAVAPAAVRLFNRHFATSEDGYTAEFRCYEYRTN
jgi:hypothetical protein